MKNLSKKQEIFYNLLIEFYNNNYRFPCLKDIVNITGFKTYSNIYRYIESLSNKKYISYDKNKKEISFIKGVLKNKDYYLVPFIEKNKYLKIDIINTNFDSNCYLVYKVLDNNLKSNYILKNDLLLIELNKNYLNNKLVLVNKNNKYFIYKYKFQNNYHMLINDKKELILENTNSIIGKVISLIRNIN